MKTMSAKLLKFNLKDHEKSGKTVTMGRNQQKRGDTRKKQKEEEIRRNKKEQKRNKKKQKKIRGRSHMTSATKGGGEGQPISDFFLTRGWGFSIF